jgi:hypothetical protein
MVSLAPASELVSSAAGALVSDVARTVFIATPAVFVTSVVLGLQRRGWL